MIKINKFESFRINLGVRLGDRLSSTIFNIMLWWPTDEISDTERTGYKLNRTTQIFAYADDITIVSETSALFKTFADIEVGASQIGLISMKITLQNQTTNLRKKTFWSNKK